MFGFRSAQSRAIVAVALGLLLLATIVALAIWRVQDTRERHDTLQHTSAVATALEDARAQTFLAATWVATAAFADESAPLHALYQQAALASREAVDQARAELIAMNDEEGLAALEELGGQMDELTQELDTLWAFSLTADRDARIETAQREMGRLWPLSMGLIGNLERLAGDQQTKLSADVEAADRASAATLWLVIGLSALGFVVVAAAGLLVMSVVWPLASLRASARAITAGDVEARAKVRGPEEVASLARDFNEMTDALLAKTKEYIDTTNLTGVTLLRVDKDNRITFLNDAMCEFLGKSREEILGTPIVDYLHPDDVASSTQAVRQMVKGRRLARGIVSRYVTPTGTRVTEWNGYPIFDEDDRYAGVHGTGRDITERKRAEEALRESETRYRQLVESSPYAIGVHSEEKFVFGNAALMKLLRASSPDEVVGKPIWDFVHPDYHERVKARIQRIPDEDGNPDFLEEKVFGVDGRVIDVEMAALSIAYQGRPARLVIVKDMTERKQAEEALRESEEKYRRLVEDSIDGIAIVQGLEVKFVNRGMMKMFGLESEADMVGHTMAEFVSPEHRTLMMERGLAREKGQDVPQWYEFKALRKDGREFDAELSVSRITYQGKVARQGVIRDITERKRAEEALRESEDRHRRLAGAAFEGLVIHEKGKFLDANPAFATMFGYELSEVIGMHALDFTAPESRDLLWQSILSKRREPFEALGLRKDGSTLLCELRGKDIPYGGRMVTVTAVRDISERKRAEEALRESEERYRMVSELTSDYICKLGIDSENRVALKMMSDSFTRVSGYTPDEVKGPHMWRKALHPDDADKYSRFLNDVISKGQGEIEARGLTKKGKTVWLHVYGQAEWDENEQRVCGVVLAAKDTTERKQAEEALRESEERHRRLAGAALEGLVIHEKGKFLDANPAFATMFGYELSEVIGMHALDFTAPESRDLLWQSILSRRGEPFEALGLRKDGSTLLCELRGKDIPYGGRMVTVTAVRDITERKRAEQALRESEERLKILFEFAPDAYFLHDLAGSFLDGNKAAEELVGYKKEELIGKNFLESRLLPPSEAPLVARNMTKWAQGLPSGPDEVTLVRKDGSQVAAEVRTFPVKIKSEDLVLGIARDISERKRAEEVLRKTREEIEGRVERRMQEVNGYRLTFRELSVLHLVAAGESDKEIATVLGISPLTAHKHMANILDKMGAASRTEAGVRALREGLLD